MMQRGCFAAALTALLVLPVGVVLGVAALDGFDRIVNATGPWAMQLRETMPGKPSYTLDWVRGSHIVLDRICPAAMLLEVPGSSRIFFVLPYQGRTLIGTTEVRQSGPQSTRFSSTQERVARPGIGGSTSAASSLLIDSAR